MLRLRTEGEWQHGGTADDNKETAPMNPTRLFCCAGACAAHALLFAAPRCSQLVPKRRR